MAGAGRDYLLKGMEAGERKGRQEKGKGKERNR